MARVIVVVRHGETEWSATGRHTGRTDLPLTAAGEERARALAPRFAGRTFAAVFTSPLSRAADTARLAGLHADVLDDLAEWDYGDVEGRTTAEMREQQPSWTVWWDGCPGGETVDQVGARADAVLARCDDIDGDVALVAHGHILRILTARWLGLPPVDGRLFALYPATWSELGYEHETRVLSILNG